MQPHGHEDLHRRETPRRVNVIGTTGSGKTTLAKAIAEAIDAPHIELDALHWEPGWTEAETDVFRARVERAIDIPAWVVDGNYRGKLGSLVHERADTIVWLDYPFRVVVTQLFTRTVRRTRSGEVLWGTNRERFREQFMSRESLFVWAIKTHWRHRRDYPAWLSRPELSHVRVVRLSHPRATARYLDALRASPPPP